MLDSAVGAEVEGRRAKPAAGCVWLAVGSSVLREKCLKNPRGKVEGSYLHKQLLSQAAAHCIPVSWRWTQDGEGVQGQP